MVIPDITREHWNVNSRKFVVNADHLEDLVRLGTLSRSAARFLSASVVASLNILMAGGTHAGNPTRSGRHSEPKGCTFIGRHPVVACRLPPLVSGTCNRRSQPPLVIP